MIAPHRFLPLLGILLTLVPVTSCRSDRQEEPGMSGGEVYLRFLITTGSGGASRAIGLWEESKSSISERIINPDDVRLYIYDLSDRLVTEIKPTDLPYTTEGNDGYYTLTAAIGKEDIAKLTDAMGDKVEFKLAVAANLKALGSTYPDVSQGDTYGNLDPVFTMDRTYYPTMTSGIPMYGVRGFSVSRGGLETSTDYKPYDVKEEIILLRSLCKVELLDRMTNKITIDGETYPRIDKVEMSAWNSDGYLRFAHNLDGTYMQDNTVKTARIKPLPASEVKSFISGADGNDYRIYLPEGELKNSSLSVWVTRGPGEESEEYTYDLSSASAFGTSELIRNHIYTLRLNKVGVTAELTATVKSWESVEIELDYSQTISMAQYIVWDTEGKDNFTAIEGTSTQKPELHIYNGTNEYIHGSFEIASPTGATWTLQIVPGSNGVNALEFVTLDGDGSISGSTQILSGVVGEKAHVYLRGVGEAPLVDCYAELVLVVRDADNISQYAPLDTHQNEKFGVVRHKPMF